MRNNAVREIIAELERLQITREETDQRERQLIDRLRAIEEDREDADGTEPQAAHPAAVDFAPGDFVAITNRLGPGHVFGRRARATDRAGTVTKRTIRPDRVYLTTFNGYRTWRASQNVRRLTQAEVNQIRSGDGHR